MYGYSQPGVDKVRLEIDKDEDNSGKSPKVTYVISLNTKAGLKWKAFLKAGEIKNPILKKMAMLAVAKVGAPVGIDTIIKNYATEYLPPQFLVDVKIVEKA
jgi:hypothetical protein